MAKSRSAVRARYGRCSGHWSRRVDKGDGGPGHSDFSPAKVYLPCEGVPGLAFFCRIMEMTWVCSLRRVSGRTRAGPRFPSPAFQPAQAAKSRTDMWAMPAGPSMGGLSPLGPGQEGLGSCQQPWLWPRGASTRPRLDWQPPGQRSSSPQEAGRCVR